MMILLKGYLYEDENPFTKFLLINDKSLDTTSNI